MGVSERHHSLVPVLWRRQLLSQQLLSVLPGWNTAPAADLSAAVHTEPAEPAAHAAGAHCAAARSTGQ